jgi:hypothetical protein
MEIPRCRAERIITHRPSERKRTKRVHRRDEGASGAKVLAGRGLILDLFPLLSASRRLPAENGTLQEGQGSIGTDIVPFHRSSDARGRYHANREVLVSRISGGGKTYDYGCIVVGE